MKKAKLLVIAGIILIGNSAKANPLAIKEAQGELNHINRARQVAKVNLNKAKKAFKNLDNAYDNQKSALKHLISANKQKIEAERASVDHIGYSHEQNPYLQDMSHAEGQIKLVKSEY